MFSSNFYVDKIYLIVKTEKAKVEWFDEQLYK